METVSNKTKDVISFFRSTVVSLNNALGGHPLAGEYDVKCQVASAGPNLMWKIYNATKRSTKEEASVFLLEKSQLNMFSKDVKGTVLEVFKKGVHQLTRLRHPNILTVSHPLEESKDCLAFATEPVYSSLYNVLNNSGDFPSYPIPDQFIGYHLDDVEIKYGVTQITDALSFLHTNVKMVHRNICPENIIINIQGFWKLTGFDYVVFASNPQDSIVSFPSVEISSQISFMLQPNLDYLAPDFLFSKVCSPYCDIFSLGLVLFTILRNGKQILNNKNVVAFWKKSISKFVSSQPLLLEDITSEAQQTLFLMLNCDSTKRPDAFHLSTLEYFSDIRVKTIQFLDNIYQRDNIQKSHFYKDLLAIIPQLPKRICLQKVLPCLVKEFHNPQMVPFVLSSILLIAEDTPKDDFMTLIFPKLIPILKLKVPVQIHVIFLNNIHLLLSKTSPDAICNHILPMVYQMLECGHQDVQDLCLNTIPKITHLVDHAAIKNALLPRIKSLCLRTSYLSVRVNCLVCIGKFLIHLDKWIVIDDILTFLPQIPSREPAVLMSILGIVKLTLDHKKLGITTETIATKIIPFLMPMTVENELEVRQFVILVDIIKDLLSKVEVEQKSKLEKINTLRQEQKTIVSNSNNDKLMSKVEDVKLDDQGGEMADGEKNPNLNRFEPEPTVLIQTFQPIQRSATFSSVNFQTVVHDSRDEQRALGSLDDLEMELGTEYKARLQANNAPSEDATKSAQEDINDLIG